MNLLRNPVRPYAWGSRTAIGQLLNRPVPTAHPEAELWMGAHPGGSSMLILADGGERSLFDALCADPAHQLGQTCTQRWDERLPFLFKVLAVEKPLSLQAHPSLEQAQEGFAREEAAGIPRDAARRNYRDPSHKPELVCALTEFHAMAGFREVHQSVKLLTELDVPELESYVDLLAAQPDEEGLRALFTTWITLPVPALAALLPKVLNACETALRSHGQFAREYRATLRLAQAYPGDVGVLATLLLNHFVLQPGEAVYLPAGNLHTYLHGTAVEIMANSDNTLRGGLTPKYVDVPELLRVLDFQCEDVPVLHGEQIDEHVTTFATPAPDFQLSKVDWNGEEESSPVHLDRPGPQILLCTRGAILLSTTDGEEFTLCQGESAWIAAADPEVIATPAAAGPTQFFRATTGI